MKISKKLIIGLKKYCFLKKVQKNLFSDFLQKIEKTFLVFFGKHQKVKNLIKIVFENTRKSFFLFFLKKMKSIKNVRFGLCQ